MSKLASQFLEEAIKLHELHMEKPKTATAKSQKLLMDLLKKHKKEMKNAK